jgi:hypothetical protein
MHKPDLANLSPLTHALAHSPTSLYPKLLPTSTSRSTRSRKRKKVGKPLSPTSMHILNIIKINYAIWNVRCYLNKLPQYYPPDQVADLLTINMEASIQNPDYFKPVEIS